MKVKTEFNMRKRTRGEIELFALHASGEEEVLLKRSNIILNGGADLMAQALAGEKFVNGMYLAYDNFDPPFADTTPPPERVASFYHDVGPGETRGVLRVPTIARATFEPTEGIYNGNKVSFTAISAGGPAVSAPFNDLLDNVSDFYGAGLGWLDPDNDITKDVLFSAVTFADLGGPTHFEKLSGAQIGLRWSIIFEAP
jgi:hypothetical protein